MNILSRKEIISFFKANELKIETPDNYYETAADVCFSRTNPFQQCSVDLHVGSIYIPETVDDALGGKTQPKNDHVLVTGGTVLISTKEKITLPKNVGALCFSPSKMALRGVMITNMGHVDPGYSGYLHFTAINMGNEPYGLKTSYDYRCCTMILFKLSEDVEPYRKGQIIKFSTNRGEIEVSDAVDNSLPYLAKDFLSIEKRAESVAEKKFNKTAWASGIFSFMAALIVAAYPLYQTYINKPWETESNKVNNKMQVLETKLDYEKRIIELEKKLDYENRVIEIEKKVNELTKKGKS